MAYLPYSYYNGVYTTLDTVRAKFILVGQYMSQAGNQLQAAVDPNVVLAGQSLYLAGVYFLQGNSALTWSPATNNTRYFLNQCFTWIAGHLNDNPTATVDLQGMIDALLAGEYLEYVDWLGIQWAIQQVLFDQPFFPEKYQAIVNRVRT